MRAEEVEALGMETAREEASEREGFPCLDREGKDWVEVGSALGVAVEWRMAVVAVGWAPRSARAG